MKKNFLTDYACWRCKITSPSQRATLEIVGGGNYSLTLRLADETLGRDCLGVCSLGIGEASQHGKLGRELCMGRHSGNRMNYSKPACHDALFRTGRVRGA